MWGCDSNTCVAPSLIVDPALKSAVELALLNNRDLRLAALNIEATRAQYGIRVANLGPTATAATSATAGTSQSASVSLGVSSWEIDLWGRLSSLKGAALATFLASEQTRDSVQASLVVSVAQSWLALDADQQKRSLANKTLQSRQRSLELIGRRHTLGVASSLERATAQAALQTAYTDTLRLVQARQQAGAETAIAVLDAQRSLYAAQQNLVSLRLVEQNNRLTLFKVLGGH